MDLITDEIVEVLAKRRYEVARLTDKYPANWLTWEKLAEQPEALTVVFREMFLNGARSDLEAVAPLIALQTHRKDREATAAAWEGKRWIVRTVPRDDPEGALDEVIARNANVHLEQMDTNAWWLGIDVGGESLHVQIGAKRANVTAHAEEVG